MNPVFFDFHTHKLIPALDEGGAIINLPLINGRNIAWQFHDRYFSAGIHPWNISIAGGDPVWFMLQLEYLLSLPQIIAVGECGLDRTIDTPLEEQILLFEWQIALSEKCGKPLIIHCVKAFDVLKQLRWKWTPKQPWIVHGFRGKPQQAAELLKAGFHLSVGQKWNEALPQVLPVSQLLVETDDAVCDKKELYNRIATQWEVTPEELDARVCHHLKTIFGKTLW